MAGTHRGHSATRHRNTVSAPVNDTRRGATPARAAAAPITRRTSPWAVRSPYTSRTNPAGGPAPQHRPLPRVRLDLVDR